MYCGNMSYERVEGDGPCVHFYYCSYDPDDTPHPPVPLTFRKAPAHDPEHDRDAELKIHLMLFKHRNESMNDLEVKLGCSECSTKA